MFRGRFFADRSTEQVDQSERLVRGTLIRTEALAGRVL
jgi:hypothetical protein